MIVLKRQIEGVDMKITVKQAAEELGVSRQFIRIGLQTGTLPIGSAVKMKSRWVYCIPEERFRNFISGGDIENGRIVETS